MAGTRPTETAATKPPRFASLRAKLIASHAFVIVLALVLVLVSSAVWLRRYERRAQIDELADLAVPLLVETRLITGQLLSGRQRPVREAIVGELFAYQAAEMDLRIVVLDRTGLVLVDTAVDGNLEGEHLEPYARAVANVAAAADRRQRTVRRVVDAGDAAAADPFADQIVLLAASGDRLSGGDQNPPVLALIAPPRRQGIVGRFIPPLLLVLAVALGVASLAGYLLSRRLAAPVTRLTVAADAMTAGQLEQQVPDEGNDEIGRLVASFNAMSHQVAATARSQRELLANIAHELRTPLTSVQGYTQALRDGLLPSPAEEQRALATIGGEAERMALLIGQLLDLTRLESGQARLDRRPVAIRPLVESVQTRFLPEAVRRGVALLVAAPPDLSALGDEARLQQILNNLVSNALRHTQEGGEIVLAAAEGSGHSIRLTVRDTGSGIPPEHLATIFDRFARGEEDGAGFGLGLAIVKELVELHGGTIAITSRVGHGTTCTIDLPASD